MLIALIVIIGLSLLILGHEAGHFFVAKLFKLKVNEFGFGFPPRIFAWRSRRLIKDGETLRQGFDSELSRTAQGETEYSFNWLPFGGFVKIAGENGELGSDEAIRGPVNDTDKRRFFFAQPAWKKSLIILAGVTVNFLIGWFLISVILMVGVPKALIISDVQLNSPASHVGIQTGDIIKNYTLAENFTKFINDHRGQSVDVEIKRGEQDLTLSVVPRMQTNPGEGAIGVVLVEGGEEKIGFFPAVWEGLKRAIFISWLTVFSFYQLFKTLFFQGSLLPGVVGPVGIFSVASETGKIGLIYLVQLISLISLNLAIVNLIPFPALDGGRFLMILIEKIKGSPISRKIESAVNVAGFVFLIFLMVVLTARDVGNLF